MQEVSQSEIPETDYSFDECAKTIIPPPRSAKPENNYKPETWSDVVKLFREKVEIWIKRNNQRWNIGQIIDMDESKKILTVSWMEPGSLLGHKAKTITFETYLKWRQEAPELPRKNS